MIDFSVQDIKTGVIFALLKAAVLPRKNETMEFPGGKFKVVSVKHETINNGGDLVCLPPNLIVEELK